MNKQYLGVSLFSVGVNSLEYLQYGFYVTKNETKTTVTAKSTN
jgi:hypothetical protein